MAQIGRPGMSCSQKAELWRRWKEGESLSDISRALAKNPGSIHGVLALRGGIAPQVRTRAARALTREQREEISRGLVADLTLRAISVRIGVSPSTTGREVSRNGGRTRYRAEAGENAHSSKVGGQSDATSRDAPECAVWLLQKLQRTGLPSRFLAGSVGGFRPKKRCTSLTRPSIGVSSYKHAACSKRSSSPTFAAEE